MSDGRLAGKIAVVTGASRGLGRAMAARFAAEGALVALHYGQNRAMAEDLAAEIRGGGGRAVVAGGDLSSLAGIDAFLGGLDGALSAETGGTAFDILVANAGLGPAAPFETETEAGFDRIFNTNVRGVFFLVQRCLARLRDGGRVITLSSGLTRFSYPQYIAYSASKGAINILTRDLAKVLGPRGITVNALAPGAIDTDFNAEWLRGNPDAAAGIASVAALGRVGQPGDIADVAAFLASDASRWITGQRIEASGGAHL